MNKTFEKLKRLQNRLSGSGEQNVEIPYEIECDCGTKVKGIRRSSWIESECPSCAERVFVLPMNVYPSTKSVPSEILGGTFRQRLTIVTGELLGRNSDSADKTRSKASQKQAETESPAQGKERTRFRLPRFSLPRIDVRQLIARTVTPFRLIMLAVIATVGLTGWFMLRQQRFEKAQQTWIETAQQIQDRLEREDLAGLLPDLEKVIDAGTLLGRNGPEFRRFENLQQETEGLQNLASTGLLDVFQRCYSSENTLQPEAATAMKEACADGWFLFDGIATRGRSASSPWMIDFPATPGLHPVSINLPTFEKLNLPEGEDSAAFRILFVARLNVQTVPSANEDGQWILEVDPASFALLTHKAHVDAAGLDVDTDATIQSIIDRQRDAIEGGKVVLKPKANQQPIES